MITRSRLVVATAILVITSLVGVSPALAQGNGNGDAASRPAMFTPSLYADGEVWGTNLNGPLPAPNANNRGSFDDLYVVTNRDQLPVAEAAPGPGYNGGRWAVVEVTWVYPEDAVLLTSRDQVHKYLAAGKLTDKEIGVYFSCPLLPVK